MVLVLVRVLVVLVAAAEIMNTRGLQAWECVHVCMQDAAALVLVLVRVPVPVLVVLVVLVSGRQAVAAAMVWVLLRVEVALVGQCEGGWAAAMALVRLAMLVLLMLVAAGKIVNVGVDAHVNT
ncbi:hypothetical protein BJV74DRAFT_864835 [Russula compacta]|nr:hypothetical protein BJV74DRAFT_864835 [Russula compacta]